MSLRWMVRKDPGFRAWVNGLLIMFWLAWAAAALALGWLSSVVFATLSLVCALTLSTVCVVRFVRRK